MPWALTKRRRRRLWCTASVLSSGFQVFFFTEVKRPGREDHPHSFTAEVKNEWNYRPTCLQGADRDFTFHLYRGNFIFVQAPSRESRPRSVRRCSTSPTVGVHAFQFKALHFNVISSLTEDKGSGNDIFRRRDERHI
jgi:hypothetical protein